MREWESVMRGGERVGAVSYTHLDVYKRQRVRLCLDARKINQIIIPDRESPEAIEEIFQKFSGVKYMTSLDLTAGYWQVPLAVNSRKSTIQW